MRRENLTQYLPVWFVRAGVVSVFTLLYGLLRVIKVGTVGVGVVTVCGLIVLAWKPSPEFGEEA